MKRFIMEFQLPNKKLESEKEFESYFSELTIVFLVQLEKMDAEMFHKWIDGEFTFTFPVQLEKVNAKFGLEILDHETVDTVFVAQIKEGPIDQRDGVVMRKEG